MENQRTPSAFSAALAGPKAVLNIRLCQALSDDMHAAMFLTHLIFFQEYSEWPPEFVDVERGGVKRKMFCRTWSDIYNYTCISQDKQVYVKKFLKETGLIDFVVMGIPAKTYYWVDVKAVEAIMSAFLEDGTTVKRSSKIPAKKTEKEETETSETGENDKNNDLQMQKQEFADANTGIGTGKFYYIESDLREYNNNKNKKTRESENSKTGKYTAEDTLNWMWENPQLESAEIPTDDFGFFDFSAETENQKNETQNLKEKKHDDVEISAVPDFFSDAPTEVQEAIEMLLRTEFQSERFAHHYKIHGGVEFLQGIANFFADPEKAIWLLNQHIAGTGRPKIERISDTWPVLAAFIAEVILNQHGYDRQGDINSHIRNFFSTHTRKSAEVSAAQMLTAEKKRMAESMAARNNSFSVTVNNATKGAGNVMKLGNGRKDVRY